MASAPLSQHSSVHHPHHRGGGWRRLVDTGDLAPHTVHQVSGHNVKPQGDQTQSSHSSTSPLFLKNLIMFLCKHPESLSCNDIKKSQRLVR